MWPEPRCVVVKEESSDSFAGRQFNDAVDTVAEELRPPTDCRAGKCADQFFGPRLAPKQSQLVLWMRLEEFDLSRAVVTRCRRDGDNESDAERKLTIRMDGSSASYRKAQEWERASCVRESRLRSEPFRGWKMGKWENGTTLTKGTLTGRSSQ